MDANEIGIRILNQLPYEPNRQQMELVAAFSRFVTDTEPRQAFVLNGYAGTGKTSLTSALVRSLSDIGIRTILLAPTGRAAKVFAAYSGHGASTIHHHIYQSRKFDPQAMAFNLKRNNFKNTYFIVDEASMISNHPGEYAVFGTGRLLDDLITYVYEGEGCRLILLGDVAQLPPVGYTDSPALSPEILHSYHLTVYSYTLTDVARQRHDSGILHNATTIRKIISSGELEPPVIRVKGYNDIEVITGEFLSEKIEECYDSDGIDETIIITRSNKRAVMFNQGVRGRVLYMESEICSGDMLLVAKNNYHWADNGDVEMDFIANGDVAIVKRMRSTSELYGFRFADVTLEFPDYHCEFDAKIILDALYSDTPALSREQNERLLNNVMEDYADIPRRAERFKKLKQDPYFNALQVKFAYSVTCHKAQGGQWDAVFIDPGWVEDSACDDEYWRWLYTAFTRARHRLYLVNFKNEFFMAE